MNSDTSTVNSTHTREIWHEILINVTPAALYRAVTEPKQLAHWWTTDTRGESTVGCHLEFWFGDFRAAVAQVQQLDKDRLVRWKVMPGGVPDWVDTVIEFKILSRDDQTYLHFKHSNWQPEAEAFPHCSLGWAIFLLSLKEFAETGKGRPYPYDLPINMWRPPASVPVKPY